MTASPLRVGVLCSSGGSAVLEATRIFNDVFPGRISLVVSTDRPCGIEDKCRDQGIPYKRFIEKDRTALSTQVAAYFEDMGGVSLALLFFLRLVTKELFNSVPTINLHPSLLPQYAGFHAIDRALADGAQVLGATAHLADDSTDGGPIIAQSLVPLPISADKVLAGNVSFCQKVLLTTWIFSALSNGKIAFHREESGNFYCVGVDNPAQSFRILNPPITPPALNERLNRFLVSQGYTDWLIS